MVAVLDAVMQATCVVVDPPGLVMVKTTPDWTGRPVAVAAVTVEVPNSQKAVTVPALWIRRCGPPPTRATLVLPLVVVTATVTVAALLGANGATEGPAAKQSRGSARKSAISLRMDVS
jgi:hypothetical protein